jgi:hypothetical protein
MTKVYEKIIRLMDLIPENYRLWVSQYESIFHIYGILDIILGYELNLNPEQATSSIHSDISDDTDIEYPIIIV